MEFAPQIIHKLGNLNYNSINIGFQSKKDGKLLTLEAFQEMIEFDRELNAITVDARGESYVFKDKCIKPFKNDLQYIDEDLTEQELLEREESVKKQEEETEEALTSIRGQEEDAQFYTTDEMIELYLKEQEFEREVSIDELIHFKSHEFKLFYFKQSCQMTARPIDFVYDIENDSFNLDQFKSDEKLV